MYHYDPNTALEELTEDATLPNPVHVRDMMLRKKLSADKSLEMNRLFVEYQKFFGESHKLGREILRQLTYYYPSRLFVPAFASPTLTCFAHRSLCITHHSPRTHTLHTPP